MNKSVHDKSIWLSCFILVALSMGLFWRSGHSGPIKRLYQEQRVIYWLEELPFTRLEGGLNPRESSKYSIQFIQEWLNEGTKIPNAKEMLLNFARKQDERVSLAQTAFVLGSFPGEDTCKVLLSLSYHNDSRVRMEAVVSLRRLGNPHSAERLANLALEDPDLNVRANACEALGRMRLFAYKSVLTQVASDESSPFVARAARWALQSLEF